MKLLVCGGRAFNDRILLDMVLNAIDRRYMVTKLASGEAAGADLLAKKWAADKKINYKGYPAD